MFHNFVRVSIAGALLAAVIYDSDFLKPNVDPLPFSDELSEILREEKVKSVKRLTLLGNTPKGNLSTMLMTRIQPLHIDYVHHTPTLDLLLANNDFYPHTKYQLLWLNQFDSNSTHVLEIIKKKGFEILYDDDRHLLILANRDRAPSLASKLKELLSGVEKKEIIGNHDAKVAQQFLKKWGVNNTQFTRSRHLTHQFLLDEPKTNYRQETIIWARVREDHQHIASNYLKMRKKIDKSAFVTLFHDAHDILVLVKPWKIYDHLARALRRKTEIEILGNTRFIELASELNNLNKQFGIQAKYQRDKDKLYAILEGRKHPNKTRVFWAKLREDNGYLRSKVPQLKTALQNQGFDIIVDEKENLLAYIEISSIEAKIQEVLNQPSITQQNSELKLLTNIPQLSANPHLKKIGDTVIPYRYQHGSMELYHMLETSKIPDTPHILLWGNLKEDASRLEKKLPAIKKLIKQKGFKILLQDASNILVLGKTLNLGEQLLSFLSKKTDLVMVGNISRPSVNAQMQHIPEELIPRYSRDSGKLYKLLETELTPKAPTLLWGTMKEDDLYISERLPQILSNLKRKGFPVIFQNGDNLLVLATPAKAKK